MTEQVPLDHLVLNLLALAEAAPHLSPEERARLAGLADRVEPTVEALSRIGLEIQTELMGVPAFDEALAAWDARVPERYGLTVDILNQELPNPHQQPATGLEGLADITCQALRGPDGFSQNTALRKLLENLLRWGQAGQQDTTAN